MIIYHGSKASFENFESDMIGSSNGTSQGHGFYFSTDMSKAKSYGDNIYKAILPIGYLPLSDESKTVNGLDLFKSLVDIADMSNYCGMSLESIIEGCESDAELIGDLINSGSIEIETVMQICHHYIESIERPDEILVIGQLEIEKI